MHTLKSGGNPPSNDDDITMDNVLGTGEGNDRVTTPDLDENGNPITPEGNEGDNKDEDPNGEEGNENNENNEESKDNLKGLLSSFVSEDGLSDDDKQIRADLLAEHKGVSFDEEGNILDKDGNQVASFEDIYEDTASEDKLTLDANGNEINDKGEIVRTNVEIAVATTVVNKLHSESEYEFLNEDGTTKIYSDDDAGVKEFTNDVSSQRFEEFKSEFFGQNPELTEVAKHLLSGGTLDTFNSPVDYSKLDIANMSESDKIKYIRQSYQGVDADRVDTLIQLFKDSNSIDAELAKAIPALIKANEGEVTKRNEAYQAAELAKQERVETYWNEINTIVTKGDLGTIKVPENEKGSFYTYLSKAVDDKGNSQEFLDRSKETKEQGLMASYLRFKGFDLSKLVEAKAQSNKVLSLKERMRQSSKMTTSTVNKSTQGNQNSAKDITIDGLLG